MTQVTPLVLAGWQNFYEILGSSAGALTGLQFVVMTLVTQAGKAKNIRDIHAFGTPTISHFCTALLIAAMMSVPWQTLTGAALCLGALGVLGIAYSLRIIWHARGAAYQPDGEDWLWYIVVPVLGHAVLVAASALMWWNVLWSPAVIAADTLLFLLLGVHNSWDSLTYIAVQHGKSVSGDSTKE